MRILDILNKKSNAAIVDHLNECLDKALQAAEECDELAKLEEKTVQVLVRFSNIDHPDFPVSAIEHSVSVTVHTKREEQDGDE